MLENNTNQKVKKVNITEYCCCPMCWKTSKMLDSCSSSSAACSGPEALWPIKYLEQKCQDVSAKYSSSLANKALSGSLYIDQLHVCLIGSSGWLIVTLLHEELGRHRGHWRSGPRHPSSVCTVCTEENHGRDIHSLPHLITHSKWKTTRQQKLKLTKFNRCTGDIQDVRHLLLIRAGWLPSGAMSSR